MRIIGYERVSHRAAGRERARDRGAAAGDRRLRRAAAGHADRPLHRGRERPQPGPAGARQGAAPRQGHRGDAGDRQARPAVAQRRLPADAARQRREVRRGRPAGGERPDRRDHGAGGAGRSARRSRSAPRRRWRWPGAAGCSSATRTARRRSGGLARAVRRSGRPLRATPTGMRGTSRRWSTDIRAGGATSLRAIAARAERPRHAHPPRRALARLDGDEPARPARAQGGGMRQSRLMSLVEAVTNVAVGLRRRGGDADARVPDPRAAGVAGAEPEAGAGLNDGPEHLRPIREFGLEQARRHRDIVARFGRHPHQKDTSGGVRPRRKWTT